MNRLTSLQLGEKGLVALELAVAFSLLAVLCSVALPIGQKFYREAALAYEANALAEDLRRLERHVRTVPCYDSEFPRSAQSSKRWTLHIIGNRYEIRRNENIKSIVTHKFVGDIKAALLYNRKYVEFYEGGTATTGTIQVFYRQGKQYMSRYVIIDLAGRVRVSREEP